MPIYGRLCTNVVVVLTIRIAGDEAPDDDRSTTRMVSKFMYWHQGAFVASRLNH